MADTEFDETFQYARRMVDMWNLNYTEFIYKQSDLVESTPELCCNVRKIEAIKEALKNYDAWVSGVRTTEGTTRRDFAPFEDKSGIVKINPILEFTEIDIWRYCAIFDVPLHPMYRFGYRSLGCKFCSTPEESAEDTERGGRWKGMAHEGGECGIHVEKLVEDK